MATIVVALSALLVVAAGVPAPSPVLRKLDGERYQYLQGPDGAPHLADLWTTANDLREAARYEPDRQNFYHLFTRQNPQMSQPLLYGDEGLLGDSFYDPQRRTIVLIHGWLDNAVADFNTVLVPAFLAAENVNVIVVDWSAGGATTNYAIAVTNVPTSGQGVARFIIWLNAATGTDVGSYHLVGHGLGGHQVGIVGRNLGRAVPYITALDPAFPGWIANDDKFRENDGIYTEVIHTNAGLMGYLTPLGHVDFYPNGGIDMPGCLSQECDHARSYFYMAESIEFGGFMGTRCATYVSAMAGSCYLWGGLNMGGIAPNTWSTGVFYMRTNRSPPFSRG